MTIVLTPNSLRVCWETNTWPPPDMRVSAGLFEHYLQLGVLGIVERIACYPRPVEVRVGLGDLGGGVVAVVIEVATPGVHEPGEGTLVWRPRLGHD